MIESIEECDDGNTDFGDGCSNTCNVERGYICTTENGEPSVCEPDGLCGNGVIDSGEGCDDGNAIGGDGCDSNCRDEPFYSCVGEPTVCEPICGDGVVLGG